MTSSTARQALHLDPLLDGDPRQVGPFHLVGRVGSGGMGSVFAARPPQDPAAEGYVAVKLVHAAYAVDPDFRARFAREVELVRRVVGPCVPRFLGADPEAETPWLATEFVAGDTLGAHLKHNGVLAEPLLTSFALGIAEALRGIHAAGIVHRDLKPGNVILAPDGPKVLDFGIARAVGETALTRTGGVVGTPGWIAPEQIQAGEPGPAADVFAWGCLVAQAARNEHAFGPGTGNTLTYRVLREEPDLTGLPEHLRRLVADALAKDPTQRPTAPQLVHALSAHLAGQPAPPEQEAATVGRILHHQWQGIAKRTPTPPPRSRRRRWPLRIAAAGVAVLLLAGLGATGAYLLGYGPGVNPSTSSGVDRSGDDATTAVNEEEQPQLPPEAVQEAVDPTSDYGGRVEVDEDGPAEFILEFNYGADTVAVRPGAHLRIQEIQQTEGGVAFSGEAFTQGIPEIHLHEENFPLLTSEGEILSTEAFELSQSHESYAELPGPEETVPVTLTYPGAPDTGLLVYRDVDEGYEDGPIPSVGVCYDVAAGFHTDYEACV
ncbi:serine/threonine-protein kinase [Lipingzhangella sp. LS1_29]|uniref:Serine/threonine-protein kinase n=1 Tax=Lipingzhangella rawalii TaxID=2055835 RepID=A0ABU2H6M7_9ACTN|nr:serine/threonine-protein kinase [Lipingzhangella rawalii]MDS1270933.1 serine/threonine-protein kinase [Lipingzhangella rawalii]